MFRIFLLSLLLSRVGMHLSAQEAPNLNPPKSPPIKDVSSKIYDEDVKSDPDKDKSYNLLHPAPKSGLRDIGDLTGQTPITLDAGHFLIDVDVLNFGLDNSTLDSVRERSFEIAPFSFKLGLLDKLDATFSFSPYSIEKYKNGRPNQRLPNGVFKKNDPFKFTDKGFGDIEFSLKYNLWGNDDGDTAFAVAPFLKIPTNQGGLDNKYFEGGVLLPFTADLPKDWSLDFTTGLEIRHDIEGSGYHAELSNSLGFSHPITSKLDGSVNFNSLATTDRKEKWKGSVGLGLTYEITRNLLFSSDVDFGVSKAAQDFTASAGFAFRF